MKQSLISHLTQVTPAWLTHVLTHSGALTQGAVAALDRESGAGNWSANARLTVRYTAEAQGALPQRLFLKLVNADLDDEFFGASEVTYYTRDYVGVADAPLIRCYDAAYSEAQRRYHLLLDDVTLTHVPAATKAPTLNYGLALAEGLAVLHARWWGAERVGALMHNAEHIQRFVNIAAPGVEHILPRFAADLQPHGPEMVRALYAKHPQKLIARAQDANGLTLIHGDVGHNNILVPRDGERPLYLIDRQPFDWSLTTWLGVYDLAYAMVLDWDSEARRQWERPVLQHYHATLLQRGVKNYAWEQLWEDYRLCVAMGVYIATEYCRGGVNERALRSWLPKLQRSLTACDELECAALW